MQSETGTLSLSLCQLEETLDLFPRDFILLHIYTHHKLQGSASSHACLMILTCLSCLTWLSINAPKKKRKNGITYLSARSVKAGDCDDAWNSTYARPKALRPWRSLTYFLPSFPSPGLYSFTLRTAAPASDLFVNSFTKPLLHVHFLFPPQSFFLATTSSWSPGALQTLPLPLPLFQPISICCRVALFLHFLPPRDLICRQSIRKLCNSLNK